MSKGKFAIGALIAAAAGFVAGVVTAPKTGSETRADIKAKADKIKADIAKKADTVTLEAQDKAEGLKDKAEDLKVRAERAVEGAKKGFFEPNKK